MFTFYISVVFLPWIWKHRLFIVRVFPYFLVEQVIEGRQLYKIESSLSRVY